MSQASSIAHKMGPVRAVFQCRRARGLSSPPLQLAAVENVYAYHCWIASAASVLFISDAQTPPALSQGLLQNCWLRQAMAYSSHAPLAWHLGSNSERCSEVKWSKSHTDHSGIKWQTCREISTMYVPDGQYWLSAIGMKSETMLLLPPNSCHHIKSVCWYTQICILLIHSSLSIGWKADK